MTIPIAPMMAAIFYLYSVNGALQNMMTVAVKNVKPFTTCPKVSKNKSEKER